MKIGQLQRKHPTYNYNIKYVAKLKSHNFHS